MKTILKRFSEPSSWAGITGLLATFGVSMEPGLGNKIAIAAAGVCGLVAFFLKEKGND